MTPAIGNTIIVYGTVLDAGANRFAAEQLQQRLNGWFESQPLVCKDFELNDGRTAIAQCHLYWTPGDKLRSRRSGETSEAGLFRGGV